MRGQEFDETRTGIGAPDLFATTDNRRALDVTARARPSVEETALAGPGRKDTTPGDPTSGVSLRGAAAPLEHPPPATARPAAKIGRYAILSELGEGGMGVVLSGYDEVLERRVAIKLVRALHRDDDRLQARLLREAQALARLSHPNVVQVYEAGALGDELFIAMEFVRGVTLSAWLDDHERAAEDILGVFAQAGRGLAAAHRVGLIHRDFKPGNVLVDLEGRVRVVDFGLAALAERAERPAGAMDSGLLDRTNFIAGTPAYMAPEQWLGGQVDARTDQFSFCVALWEALYGARPFAGQTVDELRDQVTAGGLPERVRIGPRVPPRLYKILTRGLARDPDARWPNMEALLAALAGPPVRARHFVVGLGLAAVIGLGAGAWSLYQTDRCAGGEARLAGVWDDARREAAEDAFEATGADFAAAAWKSVAGRLDQRAAAIAGMHRDACEATHLRGQQSERLLDLRMACLSRHVQEVRAVTDLLVAADAALVERSVDAVAALPPLERCADLEFLLSELPPPTDPAVAIAVDGVRRELAGVAALEGAGRNEAGLVAADAAVAAAERTAYPPVLAEALLARGHLLALALRDEPAEASLLAAFTTATASRHDSVARDAAAGLVEVLQHLGRLDDAELWDKLATAALERAPDASAGAFLDFARSRLLWVRGRYAESETVIERSVRAYDALYGPDNPATARARQWFGTALWARQEFARSQAVLPDSRASMERLYGPDHPAVAAALRWEGNLYFVLTDFDAAIAAWRRGLDIMLRAHGPDDPLVIIFKGNIAAALSRAGRPVDAIASFQEVLQAAERRLGPDHIELSATIDNLAEAYLNAGQFDRAREQIDRSLAIRRRVLGEGNAEFARSLISLGDWGVATADWDTAIPAYERALAIRAGTDVHTLLRGRAEYGLARALWLSGRDRPRALVVLDQSITTFTDLGPAGSIDLSDAVSWREEHVQNAIVNPPAAKSP